MFLSFTKIQMGPIKMCEVQTCNSYYLRKKRQEKCGLLHWEKHQKCQNSTNNIYLCDICLMPLNFSSLK